jgi:hypothetical protein
MPKLPEIPKVGLHELNESELVALCRYQGIKTNRAWPRWLLVQSLEQFEDYQVPDLLDTRREKLSLWLQRYWEHIRMQMRRKVCPNCSNCRDLQVVVCYDINRKNIEGR